MRISGCLVALTTLLTPDCIDVVLPQITGSPQVTGCGGCYVVADVAAVVFGSQYLTQMDTKLVNIQTGRNGSSYTSTSIIIGRGQLSISTQGDFGGSTAAVTINNGPTIDVNGATL